MRLEYRGVLIRCWCGAELAGQGVAVIAIHPAPRVKKSSTAHQLPGGLACFHLMDPEPAMAYLKSIEYGQDQPTSDASARARL